MKKKLIDYAIEVATSIPKEKSILMPPRQYMKDLRYFVTDSTRIVETERDIPALSIDLGGVGASCVRLMNECVSKDLDYYIHELPTMEEIKQGAEKLYEGEYNSVVWSDGYIKLNPRYLYKTMYALNAKVCYVSRTKPRTSPIFFFEDDDLQSMNRAMVLPIFDHYDLVGFYTK